MAFARAHGWILVRTGGRPSRLSPRLRCLVLETRGRRTGRRQKVPLLYLADGGGYVVIASNFGQERPPAWWLNLRADSSPAVWLAGVRRPVRARELEGAERDAVLARAVAYNRQWRSYAATVRRRLPVVRLEPVPPG